MEQLKTENQKLKTPIGTVKGPGETLHEFTFIAPDPGRQLKHGEFVYYTAPVDGSQRQILGRITARTAVKLFPDTFMADPAVPPHTVAAMLGYESDATELFELTVTVLGYYDENLQDFTNPRVPPQGGAPVFIAADETLTELLSRGRQGRLGSAYIGDLLSRDPGAVPVALDVRGFTSTHLAIIASTGSGKSYLAGVLLEELLMPYNRAAVLVIDPTASTIPCSKFRIRRNSATAATAPKCASSAPTICACVSAASHCPTCAISCPTCQKRCTINLAAPSDTPNAPGVKTSILWNSCLGPCARWGTARRVRMKPPMTIPQPAPSSGGWAQPCEKAASSTTSKISNWTSSSSRECVPSSSMNEVERREQQVIVATLLRRVYQARIDTEKGKLQRTDRNHMPFPVFSLLEEAHNFAPANADAVSSDQLKTILSEGRKFGVGVGLISQRPGRLDSDVLSQCMTQCIMRITNPIDQNRIAESVESVGRDMLKELPALSKGQVIVSGASVNTPLMLRVRTRRTDHGGEDINAPAQWRNWFEHEQPTQAAENALFAEKELERDEDGMLWA